MNCDKRELCYLAQTLCLLREVKFGVTENSLMYLGGQKENVSNKANSPPIRDFMNERYQDIQFKPLKFDCQNLPFRRSLASSKLNPFLFPQELKFNLETTSKTIQ